MLVGSNQLKISIAKLLVTEKNPKKIQIISSILHNSEIILAYFTIVKISEFCPKIINMTLLANESNFLFGI